MERKNQLHIRINVREIPAVKAAFNNRSNKKDSFVRWLEKTDPTFEMNVDGVAFDPVAA
jgi:hypothetical protein